MKLQLAKWGNSLAVRLPVACVRAAGLTEGDTVEAAVSATGAITLTPARAFDRKAFVRDARRRLAAMPMTQPTVAAMREQDRY
jgi:antitoxin MazE